MKNLDKDIIIHDDSMNAKEWYHFVWNYFSLMSTQRMQMINFYISIEIVLIGGLFALLNFNQRIRLAEYVDAFTIILMSIVFFGLDYRSKTLIHRCEYLMELIEDMYPKYKEVCPIHRINDETFRKHSLINNKTVINITYSKWFLFNFLVIGIFGIVCLVLLFCGAI